MQYMFLALAISGCLALASCEKGNDNDINVDTNPVSCCGNGYVYKTIGTDSVYIPNAFTPNGDGWNDLFYALNTDGFDSVILIVRNNSRLVFESRDGIGGFGWDGRDYQFGSSGDMPEGTYSYTFIGTSNGVTDTIEGKVCLLREGDFCPDSKSNCVMASYFIGFDAANPIDSVGQSQYEPPACN